MVFLIFGKKSSVRGISKNHWVDFHKSCTTGTSKFIDVQCKFMFKSDRKIPSYGRFKILTQAYATSEVMVLIQNFFILCFISQLLLMLGF